MPHLDDLYGSGSLKNISHNVIAFSRNLNAEDELERNTINISVLKCRLTGKTGPLPPLYYSYKTNRISKEAPPELMFNDKDVESSNEDKNEFDKDDYDLE